jgi:hypothetical protein
MRIGVSNLASGRFWQVIWATLGPPGYVDLQTYPYAAYPSTYPNVWHRCRANMAKMVGRDGCAVVKVHTVTCADGVFSHMWDGDMDV